MREFTIENSGTNTNLIYTLKNDDIIDTVALGMMENNKIAGLLPMYYTQVDKNKLLKYNVTSRVTMQQLFERSVTRNIITKCFSNIIDALVNAEDYMIDINTILVDINSIYVNVSTLETELLCLPVIDDSKRIDIEMFFKSIIFSVQFDQTENCDYVAKLISYLNSGSFSLKEFRNVLREIEGIKSADNNTNNDVQQEQPIVNNQIEEQVGKTIVDASSFDSKAPVVNTPVEPKMVNIPIKQNSIPSVTMSPMNVDDKKVKKEKEKKEKKGLFGKKKEPKKDITPQPMIIPGMAIPSIEPVTEKKEENNKTNIVVPGSAVKPIERNADASIPQTTFTQTNANFGETTVLGVPSAGIGETTVLGVSSGEAQQAYEPKPYLIRKKNNERILISKSVFKIGKENSYVDYFIGDNTAISRSHATILIKGLNYYVMDTNSKNHTYVNGSMISPNIEVPLKPGVIIKLADEEFEFVMQ